jgi:hypothetical protein
MEKNAFNKRQGLYEQIYKTLMTEITDLKMERPYT